MHLYLEKVLLVCNDVLVFGLPLRLYAIKFSEDFKIEKKLCSANNAKNVSNSKFLREFKKQKT